MFKDINMTLKNILVLFIVLFSTFCSAKNRTELTTITQADSSRNEIYKTTCNGLIFYHDCDGYIVAFNEKDMNWYYTHRQDSSNDDDGSVTSKYYFSNLKYGIEVKKRRKLFREYYLDGDGFYRVSMFNTTPPPPPPPPPIVVEEEVYDFMAIQSYPELMKGCTIKAQDYITKNYPPLAKKSGVSGIVIINFVISKEGIPTNLSVVLEKPKDMGFGEVAIKAVEQYRFIPGMQRDKPVPVRSDIKISFNVTLR
jgi:TonB family protein